MFWNHHKMCDWVDMNMTHEMGQPGNHPHWRYIFREASYGIWWFWNRKRHNDNVLDTHHGVFARTTLQRVHILLKAHMLDVDENDL